MSFDIRAFIMQGLIAAIGVQSDYWVILEAARWYDKGVLKDGDLQLITEKIEQKNIVPVSEPVVNEEISIEEDENEIPFEENENEENINNNLEEQDMEERE